MARPRGCLKNSLIGCGALIGLVVMFVAVMAALAFFGRGKGGRVERAAAPAAGTEAAGDSLITVPDPVALTRTHPGRVILDLGQGEFHLVPADSGAGLGARATFDSQVHELVQSFAIAPDSTWTSRISFHQTMPGLQALFRRLMGEHVDASITVMLPREVPIVLVARMEQGGAEAELGGLWLRTADFDFRQGGFELDISDPLREPVERLRLHGSMGGVQATGLGNASPRVLSVDCRMGGADIGLDGAWRNDCDGSFRIRLGGMALTAPRDLDVQAVGDLPKDMEIPVLRRSGTEVPVPVLRARFTAKMGEIAVQR